jgi:hypothetical protein
MSKISNAILETLLEEITDYANVELTVPQRTELENLCDRWEDRESIETEINTFLKKVGFVYDDGDCSWKGDNKTLEITSTLVDLFDKIGIDTPNNFSEICEFVVEDVNDTADADNWHDGDVAIAFRRWIEAQADEQA